MNQDEEHLRLLSIFHYVCAGLIALCACIPIFHVVLGLMMVFRPEVFGPHDTPPPFLGWMFAIIGGGFVLLGWAFAALMMTAGRCLKSRTHHTFCTAIAAIACVFMPVGTALGVFTIIVLVRPSVKKLFNVPVRSVVAA